MKNKLESIKEFIEVLDILRVQCPWDRKQTIQTLRNMTIEECFELCDAIDKQDAQNLKEELGDLFLHILFYAKIAEEEGLFDIADVANAEVEKLKFRHPHIFSDVKADTAEEVLNNWEKLKKIEKGESRKTVLSGVPVSLPAISRAEKIQKKVAKVGFDWEKREDVWEKVNEELLEVREAVGENNPQAIEEEFGDLLFSVVNACRLYGVSPETALAKCNDKFIRRFELMESKSLQNGLEIEKMSLSEMDKLWVEAKNELKNKK